MNNKYYTPEDLPLILTVDELAHVLDIGRHAAYTLVRSGQIPSIRVGRSIRIPKPSVLQFLALPDTGQPWGLST